MALITDTLDRRYGGGQLRAKSPRLGLRQAAGASGNHNKSLLPAATVLPPWLRWIGVKPTESLGHLHK
jgi:hypothetical protein